MGFCCTPSDENAAMVFRVPFYKDLFWPSNSLDDGVEEGLEVNA